LHPYEWQRKILITGRKSIQAIVQNDRPKQNASHHHALFQYETDHPLPLRGLGRDPILPL
jgi:hypothetical protein